MKIDNNILFELVYDIEPDYKCLQYKDIQLLTEINGEISFFFSSFSFKYKKKIRQSFRFSVAQYNNKLRNKKLNSL